MKLILYLVTIQISLLISLTVFGQKITYSDYENFDYRDGENVVLGMVGGQLYIYRSSGSDYQLDAYNDSMNKNVTVLLDFFPRKIYQVRFFTYPDKIIILYQAIESNKVVQYAVLLDERGRMKSKPIELGVVKTGILGATKTYFSSVISENKKFILVYSVNEKSKEIDFDGKWLDDNLNILKKSRATFQTDNSVEHGEMNIANDGNAYLAAFTPEGIDNYADQFWLLKIQPGENKFDPIELPLENRFAASGYMKIDNLNNKIYFGGFYSDRKNGALTGTIFSCFDVAEKKFQSLKFLPFDKELMLAAGARRANHVFDNYVIRQLILKKDGGFILVSEVNFVTTRSSYNPGMGYYSFYVPYSTSTVREYHYNDIMALSYDKEGKREWSSFVNKEQYSQEDGGMFSSYAFLNSGGTLAFLFNDFNKVNSRINLATLDANGKINVSTLDAQNIDYPDWLPKSGKQVSARTLVIPCLHKRQICFAKVVF